MRVEISDKKNIYFYVCLLEEIIFEDGKIILKGKGKDFQVKCQIDIQELVDLFYIIRNIKMKRV